MPGRTAKGTVGVVFAVHKDVIVIGNFFVVEQQRVCLVIKRGCRIQVAAVEQYVGQSIESAAEIAGVPSLTGYGHVAAGVAFRCLQVAAGLEDVGCCFQCLRILGLAFKARLRRNLGCLWLAPA